MAEERLAMNRMKWAICMSYTVFSMTYPNCISSFLRSEALQSFGDWKFPYKETKSTNKLPCVAI